jgi:hypothetical protein
MTQEHPRPDQEGFGEASLGEGQAEDPALDPDMLEDDVDPGGLDDLDDVEDLDADTGLDPDDPDLGRI